MAASPIYNWTGFYIGGHVGGAFGGDNNILAPGFTGTSSNDGVFMGGAQVGYDHQFSPNWVLGIEANYSFLDTNNNPFVNRGLGSVTGRLGYTWGPAMVYAGPGGAGQPVGATVVLHRVQPSGTRSTRAVTSTLRRRSGRYAGAGPRGTTRARAG